MSDKVSIIMGIYNCEATLPAAIDSIIAQTYANWELIMCDDASTDCTYEIAKSYKEKYPDKIILIKNEKNSRLAFTLNHCLQYATGKFVARMDGDDISVPERLEKQVEYLNTHPDIQLVGSSMQRFNENGLLSIDYALNNPNYYTLKTAHPFNHATIMTYKYVYDKLDGYTVSERTARGQDYDLWFRFYNAGFNGNNIREPLYLVREDDAAIRRRTFKVRWNSFRTTAYGFKLLGYPKYWIVKPFVSVILKSLTPYKLQNQYRLWQKKRDTKS